ncbi:unnamed protein product [Schistocephalus solidus]|uniref:Dynein light chain n=1 Tax=Schistocephalus solidus TaxID=70667 RepID=A0A0V0JBQ8_SCHSO|nr:unnamed protein product [Schistocephalus solidus]
MALATQSCNCIQQDEDPCANKPRFIRHDLNEKLESFFLEMVYRACNIYDDPVELCTALKQCLDKKFGPMWHVIVGQTFGGHFEHDPKSFAYIQFKGLSFLMFKFG